MTPFTSRFFSFRYATTFAAWALAGYLSASSDSASSMFSMDDGNREVIFHVTAFRDDSYEGQLSREGKHHCYEVIPETLVKFARPIRIRFTFSMVLKQIRL